MKIITIGKIGTNQTIQHAIYQWDDVKIEKVGMVEDEVKNTIESKTYKYYTLPDGTIPDNPSRWQSSDIPNLPDGYIIINEIPEDINNKIITEIGTWIALPEPIPQRLSRYQIITVLKDLIIKDNMSLYKLSDQYIKTLDTSIAENDEVVDAWIMASEFNRYSSVILMIQREHDLTELQLDEIFIKGAKITE
ncbi:hypothetical protein GCM10023211_02450 [Orbus sasakiae]|uniref:Uncharacterized protein n=1 Tax=Orbus sasakiae TaxID=1078475 RepID=A0ABP9MYS5_9GAMM